MNATTNNITLGIAPTPLAFLPPSLASEFTIATYVIVGTTSVCIWDALNTLTAEYLLFTRHKLHFHSVVYYISRKDSMPFLKLSTIAGVLSGSIFQTAPVGDCKKLSLAVSWLFFLAVPSTSLLFFFRVKALYNGNRFVVAFFFLLWLAIVGGSFATSLATDIGKNIGPTRYCVNGDFKSSAPTVGTVVVIYDTLVFLAISGSLLGFTTTRDSILKHGFKTLIMGANLPAFSKAFLQDGQMYYLSTIGFAFATTIVLHIKSMPLIYRVVIGFPNAMLMNVMACRVYRNTKLGVYREHTSHIINEIVVTIPPPVIARSEGTTNVTTPPSVSYV